MDDLEREEREALRQAEEERQMALIEKRERELSRLSDELGAAAVLPEIPEGAEFEQVAEALEVACLKSLALIGLDEKQSTAARVTALNSVLDRSRGKPVQESRVTVTDVSFKEMLAEMLEMRKGVYIKPENVIEAQP